MSEITSVLPVLTEGETYRITSPFGYRRDPVSGAGNGQHKGIDLVLWRGYGALSAVGAAWDGTVIAVRDEVPGFEKTRSAGNFVVIDHGGGTVTRYYHLAYGSVAVSPGEHVTAGQHLGQMGSTGYSTGAHLHFQLERDGVPVDPLPALTGEADLLAGTAADGGSDPQADNVPAEWAAEAVAWARENGILYGDETGNLHLREPITCERMIVFLYRAFRLATEGSAE